MKTVPIKQIPNLYNYIKDKYCDHGLFALNKQLLILDNLPKWRLYQANVIYSDLSNNTVILFLLKWKNIEFKII